MYVMSYILAHHPIYIYLLTLVLLLYSLSALLPGVSEEVRFKHPKKFFM